MPEVQTPKKLGRPRRFEPGDERALLLGAALTVLRRNDFSAASVADILTVADVSTRAFYRHFDSKDELLAALYESQAEETAAQLAEKIAATTSSRAAFDAWIDHILTFAFDARRAERVAIMSSEAVGRAVGGEVIRSSQVILTTPLVAILEAAKDDGTFPTTEPARDAVSIHRLVLGLVRDVVAGAAPDLDRAAAREHIMRFVLPALGARVARSRVSWSGRPARA